MERKTGAKPHPGGGFGPEEVSGNRGEEIPDDTDINEAIVNGETRRGFYSPAGTLNFANPVLSFYPPHPVLHWRFHPLQSWASKNIIAKG